MRKKYLTTAILILLASFASCSSMTKVTMKHGIGALLGEVSATATLVKSRAGRITGDIGKYGYFDRMPDTLVKELKGARKNPLPDEENPADPTLAEKAYAVAAYQIIQQIKAKGGNAVANVLSNVEKNFDPVTRIETVTVIITAQAIKR